MVGDVYTTDTLVQKVILKKTFIFNMLVSVYQLGTL